MCWKAKYLWLALLRYPLDRGGRDPTSQRLPVVPVPSSPFPSRRLGGAIPPYTSGLLTVLPEHGSSSSFLLLEACGLLALYAGLLYHVPCSAAAYTRLRPASRAPQTPWHVLCIFRFFWASSSRRAQFHHN